MEGTFERSKQHNIPKSWITPTAIDSGGARARFPKITGKQIDNYFNHSENCSNFERTHNQIPQTFKATG